MEMRKLKTHEEIIRENKNLFTPKSEMFYSQAEVDFMIIAAQRDALECAAENGEVINEGTYGADGQSTDHYVLDKSSILNLIPKEK